jgi:SpoVK/Ycf46/Vps4 family AAA+-type ATPase
MSAALPRDIEAIAAQFRIDPQTIASLASNVELRAAPGERRLQRKELWQACREACAPAIAGLAERIDPRFTWDDLVLPAKVISDLKALAGQVPGRTQVLGRWGFSGRWRQSGASALFAGASGTGKSMAAEVIAGALDLDLYRIELSGVVSKYIGETEKNLQRIFQAAEASGAVLLFDEADAIFGKRSEVKDAHDRYANIEVSYLLQAMERYRGLAILSTNMKSNVDQAFFRRLSYVIDFPRPDQPARERIWRLAIPRETPTQGLDFARLARMDLAGGSIVRIALNAAYLAAAAQRDLSMEEIFQAAAAEHRKFDKEFRAP